MKRRQLPPQRIASIGIACLLGLLLIAYALYLLALRPVSSSAGKVYFTISSGERVPQIADALLADHLIRDRNAFITYVTIHDIRGKLQAGTYALAPDESTQQIAGIIASGETVSNRLIVPDGYDIKQIEFAAAELGISKASFEAALAAPHTQPFLKSKPAGVGLEGYLFPDSYEVNKQTTAIQLVNEMLQDFGQKVGREYVQAFAAEGLTLHQGLTIASIVEREVSNPSDRPIVAQVFLKRYKLGMPLGSDVTAAYAAEQLGVPFSTSINSPYNTLNRSGLPPGPICSPGLGALDAVAHPASTDYLYFLTGKNGKTYFATTYAQHLQNIAKYLN